MKKKRAIYTNDDVEDGPNGDAIYGANDTGKVTSEEVRETFTLTFKVIMSVVVAAIISLVALYAFASGTVASAVHLGGGEFVWTERDAWEGGVPATGDQVTATIERPAANDFIGKVIEGVYIPTATGVFEIVGGPFGIVTVDEDTNEIIYNNEPTGLYGSLEPRALENEYLTICAKGDCKANSYYYVSEDYIIGKAEKYLGKVS